MPPPWPGNGEPLRQMLRTPEEWTRTRRSIRGIGYWPWLLNQHFHNDDIRALFAGVEAWNLKLGFEVKRIEDRCRSHGIAFSLIYWSADEPRLARAGQSSPRTWRTGILKQKTAYAQAGGAPDQIVIESWLHVPASALPESDPDTFTGSVLEFLKKP